LCLIMFITELQNFNLVQSRDRTDCQSIEQLANHQDTSERTSGR
jgi:hypothetical protein